MASTIRCSSSPWGKDEGARLPPSLCSGETDTGWGKPDGIPPSLFWESDVGTWYVVRPLTSHYHHANTNIHSFSLASATFPGAPPSSPTTPSSSLLLPPLSSLPPLPSFSPSFARPLSTSSRAYARSQGRRRLLLPGLARRRLLPPRREIQVRHSDDRRQSREDAAA